MTRHALDLLTEIAGVIETLVSEANCLRLERDGLCRERDALADQNDDLERWLDAAEARLALIDPFRLTGDFKI